jgi:RNA recognition motif-containing protein
MVITTAWRKPSLLPDRPEVVKPQLESREVSTQYDRISKVPQVRYEAEYDVPTSPAPLSDVEQALDMTSQASAVIATIPFFAPQLPAAAITPIPDATPAYSQPGLLHTTPAANISLQPQFGSAHASAETLQALGLPMFLIGQNVQALQTLASTPSLLSTFVDANGMYDQPRLMNLVQTLSQNIAPGPSQGVGYGAQPYQQAFSAHAPAPSYGTPATAPAPSYGTPATAPAPAYSPPGGIYGPASTSYGQTSSYNNFESGGSGNHGASLKNGYRGNQNDDGNLHLSGYGPTTTSADIITLFSPYVKVDEVVMKGTFTFVNTSDPTGAQRAREALGGALLGGMPIRIKPAQRKARDLSLSGSAPSSIYGPASTTEPRAQPSFAPPKFAPPAAPPSAMAYGAVNDPVPANAAANGYIDVDAVRDDRGNPATKNLFVAGYGPGTTELQLRDIFSSHGPVVGVVLKGSFSFVNTYDRLMAIRSREALNGTLLNGGVLRINFAKETGRLGTSFDLTYGPNTAKTHYGRSYV